MHVHEIRKGLDVPLAGAPVGAIRGGVQSTRVAVMADDFPGMKPAMKVEEGQEVKRGQVLFEDRKCAGVLHTSPGAGRIAAINRGARRALQSIVIELSEAEKAGSSIADEQVSFSTYTGKATAELSRQQIVDLLVESGQWTALRARPYNKVPSPSDTPAAVFVTAIDTNPHAPVPDVIIDRKRTDSLASRREDFNRGLELIAKLTEGTTYLCVHADETAAVGAPSSVRVERFRGPHPAGLVGTHIHLLEPVSREKTVWAIGYQDVIAIGHLFATGELDVERVVSVAGPMVDDPRLVRTRLGASVDALAGDEGGDEEVRIVAGSALSGKAAKGDVFGFLGRYENQVSVLREGRERVFMGWLTPGWDAFSSAPIYISRLFGKRKKFPLSTSTNGSHAGDGADRHVRARDADGHRTHLPAAGAASSATSRRPRSSEYSRARRRRPRALQLRVPGQERLRASAAQEPRDDRERRLMKFLRDLHDKVDPLFAKGGKLEKLYPLWEAHDTAMFTPGQVTRTAPHVRDGMDLKRMMITVVVALVPCILFAIYNTGYQALYAISQGAVPLDDWRMAIWSFGGPGLRSRLPACICVMFGALYFLPVLATVFAVGALGRGGRRDHPRPRGERGLPRDRHAAAADPAAHDPAVDGDAWAWPSA